MKLENLSPEQTLVRLNGPVAWDWVVALITGDGEEREHWVLNKVQHQGVLRIQRETEQSHHRFRLQDERQALTTNWSEMEDNLSVFIKPGQRVLLDTTQMGFEVLLYVLPALKSLGLEELFCAHVVPNNYIQDTDNVNYSMIPIEQPKGYQTLSSEMDRERTEHIIILGFDRWRPSKFIDKYDWDLAHVHVVLGDPPFTPGGTEKALASCKPWIDELQRRFPGHIHRVDAADPEATALFFAQRLDQAEWLDVVPLGPKSMLLGFLSFFFRLEDEEQARIRLLHDFALTRAKRSGGVSKVLVLPCKEWPS